MDTGGKFWEKGDTVEKTGPHAAKDYPERDLIYERPAAEAIILEEYITTTCSNCLRMTNVAAYADGPDHLHRAEAERQLLDYDRCKEQHKEWLPLLKMMPPLYGIPQSI
ncbi:hypothetical protein RvY_17944 [Ramazzottius varieornatus]|uniref:Uncharacterized protein n=1 Tax=Ramazzottius varieornatus TaxID=947166 RepID=A0A1D1W7J9_RAMVA|nr:hypothetical protein RvY_17944 [Ramazzottius varieornatus]